MSLANHAASRYRIDYEKCLNRAQFQAVTHEKGPLLVIAGAGSGKTRTLTYRVARLVENGVPPEAIVLLSFTRKASQEMLKRAAGLLDNRVRKVSGGTFHSFANAVLRRHGSKIGIDSDFIIMDRKDTEDLIGLIRKEIGKTEDKRTLPQKTTLASIFSKAVNKRLPIEDILDQDYPHFGYMVDLIYNIWEVYRLRKREHHFVDYDDLLTLLHQLLNEHHSVCDELHARHQYIMVDEYQDTNQVQADIVSLLAGDEKNVMVVGDDAQSIYAFRGANFKNIITFPQRFPGTRIIKLEQNYRSLQPILDLTNDLIGQAAEKYTKKLFTELGGGELPRLVAVPDEPAQSHYVVSEIVRQISHGHSLDDIAVLFRASFHAFDLELALQRRGVPFVKHGGFKFAESAHVKDLLAHLRIIVSPLDRLSWYRILLLVEKIGPKTAQKTYEAVVRQNRGAKGLLNLPFKTGPQKALEGLKSYISQMAFAQSVRACGELALACYLPHLEKQFDDYPRRLRDLEQLLTIMERYPSLDTFLADMALEPPNTSIGDGLSAAAEHPNTLTLSTIHSAKGLEWEAVFIIWALDGRFPSYQSIDNPENLEEELRLMYVAATRAKTSLYILYPAQVYDRITDSILYKPSRFLEGVAPEMLDRVFYRPHE